MLARFYKGFSTSNWLKNKSFALNDIELVKKDLLNHIWTVKGERVMMPNFGTSIPVLVFEPNDVDTIQVIEQDLRDVFEYDPRVQLLDLQVASLPDNSAIVAFADLLYIEFNVKDTLKIEIPTN